MENPYIETEESILCLDQNRQYYLIIEEAEFYHCKTIRTGSYVCTRKVVECLNFRKKREV